jgi:uncharacterized protein
MILADEEVYLLPYEKATNKKLVYAPKRGAVELIEQPITEWLADDRLKMDSPVLKQLVRDLRKTPCHDLDAMKRGLPDLNVDLSDGCNLRCLYCFAARGENRVTYQKKEHIDFILDTYYRHLFSLPEYQKNIHCGINFTNDAEPTFAPDLLRYTVGAAIKKAAAFEIRPTFILPTNGAFARTLRPFIIQYFKAVSCSFDGLPWIQNLHRPLCDGQPSFERVYENVKALYESDIKLVFSVVVTRYNVDFLKETIDFFDQNFPGSSVSFGQLHLHGRADADKEQLAIDQQHFDQQFMMALQYGSGTSIQVSGKYGHENLLPRRHYCSSTARPNWSVSINGAVYACMEEKSAATKIGQFDFGQRTIAFDQARIKTLAAKTVDGNESCCDCFAKYLCAGGCVCKAESQPALCRGIRQRAIQLINQHYEEKMMRKNVRDLFKISDDCERR